MATALTNPLRPLIVCIAFAASLVVPGAARAASAPPRYLSKEGIDATLKHIARIERGCYVGEQTMIDNAARRVSVAVTYRAAQANVTICQQAATDFAYGRDYMRVSNTDILAHLFDRERVQAQDAILVDSDMTNYIDVAQAGGNGQRFLNALPVANTRLEQEHATIQKLLVAFKQTGRVN